LVVASAIAVIGASPATAAAATRTSPSVVIYRDGVDEPGALTSNLERTLGLHVTHSYGTAVQGFAGNLTAAQADALRSDPDVASVEPDKTFTAAGLVPTASGEAVQPGVRRIGAASTTQVHEPAGVGVAILDTGVDLANADLDAANGKNCITTTKSATDDNGHGTHVAGIVAARNNGSRVVGVAPGTKVYSVKVLNARGSGTLSQILCGIDWVTENAAALNIKVANMSIVGPGSNDDSCGYKIIDSQHKAICKSTSAGVSYVAAAGNSAMGFGTTIPAAYPEVLTATAMSDSDGAPGGVGAALSCKKGERDDRYATYSNFALTTSQQSHTVAAPGTCVVSDKPGGGIATYYGTSQSAPHVAGTVALCLGNGGTAGPCSGLTSTEIIQKIRDDATAAATPSNGFLGDLLSPVTGKFFGPLVAAGGY
jgi:subtilisin family serine protease